MALHGTIQVNGRVIGVWKAQRKSHVHIETPLPDAEVEYDCRVSTLETLEGNPAVSEEFVLTHRFGNGALALAAKVLTYAYTKSDSALP